MAVATLSVCRWLLPCGMRRHIITHPWGCECLYWTAYWHFRLGGDSASTLVLGEKRHRIGRQPCGYRPTIRLPVLLHSSYSNGADRVFRITCCCPQKVRIWNISDKKIARIWIFTYFCKPKMHNCFFTIFASEFLIHQR